MSGFTYSQNQDHHLHLSGVCEYLSQHFRAANPRIPAIRCGSTPLEIEFSVNTTKTVLPSVRLYLVALQWRLFFCLITCHRLQQLVHSARDAWLLLRLGTCHGLHKYAYAPQTFAKLFALDAEKGCLWCPKFMRKLLTFSKINATSEILHMHANTRQAA